MMKSVVRAWIICGLVVALVPSVVRAGEPGTRAAAIVDQLAGPGTRGRAVDTDLSGAMEAMAARLGELGEVIRQPVMVTGVESANLILLREPQAEDLGYVVLGAHYDHLGVGGADDPNEGATYFGADDNASGCATVLLAAEALFREYPPTGRGLAVVLFTGEERGLVGSRAFLQSGPLPVDKIDVMVNVDTVGRLSSGQLTVFGTGSARVFRPTLDGLNTVFDLPLQMVDPSSGASDDLPFVEAGIASLHLFTGAWPQYHRPTDTVDLIDFDGIVTLAEFTAELVDYLADPETSLDFVAPLEAASLADPARTTEGRRRVSFGSIPDFQFEGEGVLLSGVLPGSPAAGAGLQAGDVIVSFDGAPVADLTDYSELMKQHNPGDVVQVEYLRDGQRVTAEVTLVERR